MFQWVCIPSPPLPIKAHSRPSETPSQQAEKDPVFKTLSSGHTRNRAMPAGAARKECPGTWRKTIRLEACVLVAGAWVAAHPLLIPRCYHQQVLGDQCLHPALLSQ